MNIYEAAAFLYLCYTLTLGLGYVDQDTRDIRYPAPQLNFPKMIMSIDNHLLTILNHV